MAQEDKSKPVAQPAVPSKPLERLEKSYKGVEFIANGYREEQASYRGVPIKTAPLPPPPLRGAPAKSAPASSPPGSPPPSDQK